MSDQERPTDPDKRDEQKTTITIAERPGSDEPGDEKETITVAEKGGE
jgi:hypothetical protein